MIAELEKIYLLVQKEEVLKKFVRAEKIRSVSFKNKNYPLYQFEIGSENPEAPSLILTGGIHGIERIGAQLAWSLLKTTLDKLIWDKSLQDLLKNIRIVFFPLVNPAGYEHFSRANPRGVDLMRNSPIECKTKPFLLGGQRISSKLPWYQGEVGVLETENQFLFDSIMKINRRNEVSLSIDFHSGFGLKDRLWFPFSNSKEVFPDTAELHALVSLFENSHPYHIYQIEPQSEGYQLAGDMWDYLYLELKKVNPKLRFIPMTLEMGSWNWIRKNPLQLFSKQGIYNPIKDHRIKRTYRRHHLLYEFLLKALNSNEIWNQRPTDSQQRHWHKGNRRWYKVHDS